MQSPTINFYAPVTININVFMSQPQPHAAVLDMPSAAPPQLPAPDVTRLYAPEVDALADQRFGPRPYLLTLDMRREIAEWLDRTG